MIHRTTNACGCEYYGTQRTYACNWHLSNPHAQSNAQRQHVAQLRMAALVEQTESMRCFRLGLFVAAEHHAQVADGLDAQAMVAERMMEANR